MSQPDVISSEYANTKRKWFYGMLIYSACFGFLLPFLGGGDTAAADVILNLPFLAYGLAWCMCDAGERGIRLSFGFKIMLALFSTITIPYYMVHSRGWKGGLRQVMLAIGFLCLAGVCVAFTALFTMMVRSG